MLLPRISTNVSVAAAEPDGDPLARFLDSIAVTRDAAARNAGAAVARPAVSRHRAARGAARRASRGPAGRTDAAVQRRGTPVSASDVLPVLFRRELDLQQRFFAMGEAIAHLNHLWHRGRIRRTVAPDGAIRFAA